MGSRRSPRSARPQKLVGQLFEERSLAIIFSNANELLARHEGLLTALEECCCAEGSADPAAAFLSRLDDFKLYGKRGGTGAGCRRPTRHPQAHMWQITREPPPSLIGC